MKLKDYAIAVLAGKIDAPIGPLGFQFFRVTPRRVLLLVWDSEKQIKAQLTIISEDKKVGERDWELILEDFKWVDILRD